MAGLNVLDLSIDRVAVDGNDAEFDLRTYLQGLLPAALAADSRGEA